MEVGDLVRHHGGLLSTAPIGLVLHIWTRSDSYDRLLVLWSTGYRRGNKNWEPAYRMEKVLAK